MTLQCGENHTEEGCIPQTSVCFFFSKPFLTLFDIYFYMIPIRYTASFLDFSPLGTCSEVGTWY